MEMIVRPSLLRKLNLGLAAFAACAVASVAIYALRARDNDRRFSAQRRNEYQILVRKGIQASIEEDAVTAETCFVAATALQPTKSVAHFELAKLYESQGRDREEWAQFASFLPERLQRGRPPYGGADAAARYGDLLRKRGRNDLARAAYEATFELRQSGPSPPGTLTGSIGIQTRLGELLGKAEGRLQALFAGAAARAGHSLDAAAYLAHMKAGRWCAKNVERERRAKEAAHHYGLAIRLYPRGWLPYCLLADTLAVKAKPDEVAQLLLSAQRCAEAQDGTEVNRWREIVRLRRQGVPERVPYPQPTFSL